MKRIEKTFAELKKKGEKALVAYITAGYPDLGTTRLLIPALERAGVSAITIYPGWHESPVPTVAPSLPKGAFAHLRIQIRAHLGKHPAKHLRRQHPRVGVVARAMIAVVELQRAGLMDRTMSKRRCGGAKRQDFQHRVMRDAAECHDGAQFGH